MSLGKEGRENPSLAAPKNMKNYLSSKLIDQRLSPACCSPSGLLCDATLAATKTLVVTSGDEPSFGSLRQVLQNAAASDTFTFPDCSVYGDSVLLASGEFVINKNLTIDSGGSSRTISDNPVVRPTFGDGSTQHRFRLARRQTSVTSL